MLELTNRKILDFRIDHQTYVLEIALEKTYIEGWDSFCFVLCQRHQNQTIPVPHTKKFATNDFFVYELEIDISETLDFILEGEMIDLSIIRVSDSGESRSRIKSHGRYLEFYPMVIDDTYILRPVTTREGNISFYVREKDLRAIIEEVSLSEAGELQLLGIYHASQINFDEIRQIQLAVTAGEETVYLDAQAKMLPHQYALEPWYDKLKLHGFSATIDLKPYMSINVVHHLKFHLILTYEKDGIYDTIESTRIKLAHWRQKYPLKRKLRHRERLFAIQVRPTKKAKFVQVQIGEYQLIREISRTIHNKWVEIRRSKQLLNVYKSVFYVVGRVVPPNHKLVMFESFHGKQFSDNPRAIYEYMREHCPDYSLVWSVDRRHIDDFKQLDVQFVRRFSIKWLLYMTTAKYWIVNARLPLWIPKPKHTTYVQTWHGTPLKRLATDMDEVHMPGTNTAAYKQNFIYEASKWDYLISPNAYSTKIFRRAFQFHKTMIESGYPRNDYLINHNNQETMTNLKRQLGIDPAKKVLLYAPTWRDNQFYSKGRYKFQLELDLDRLKEAIGDKYVIVLRLHYLVAENLDLSDYEGFAYDFSNYPDIRDLYLMADLLMTDYSSVFFDYANLRRPMIFFVYDIEDYRDHLRGFYFNFEEKAPGPLTRTTDEVIAEILKIERHGFVPSEEYEAFYEQFCYLEDGRASERVVKAIFKGC